MDKRFVYLDHQATTPVLEEALQAMLPYFREAYGSPSSLHRYGLQVRDGLKEAREQIARMINAESDEDLIFTSGGTESSNLAIKGFADANHRKGNHIVVSAIEHPLGHELGRVPDQARLRSHAGPPSTRSAGSTRRTSRAAITEKTILVCVHLVNHDIGTIQPVKGNREDHGGKGNRDLRRRPRRRRLDADRRPRPRRATAQLQPPPLLRPEGNRRPLPQPQGARDEPHSRRRAGGRTPRRN